MVYQEVKTGDGLEMSYLFTEMQKVDGQVVVKDFTPIMYNTVNGLIKGLAKDLGLDIRNVGSHCLRIGGATGYTQRGVSPEVVMAKGRWRCKSTRLRYARVTNQNVIETSNIF